MMNELLSVMFEGRDWKPSPTVKTSGCDLLFPQVGEESPRARQAIAPMSMLIRERGNNGGVDTRPKKHNSRLAASTV